MNPANPMSQMATASKMSITQLQQALRNGTIDPLVGQTVLRQKIKQAESAKLAMAAQQPAQPPVAQQNMAYQGVDQLPTNLPVQGMAKGGILAFAGDEGSLVPDVNVANLTPFGTAYSGLKNVRDVMGSESAQTIAGIVRKAGELESEYLSRVANTLRIPVSAVKQMPAAKPDASALQPTPNELARQRALSAPVPAPAAQPAVAPPTDADVNNMLGITAGDTSGRASTSTRSRGIAGSASPYEIKKYDSSELKDILASEMNPATGKPWTYAEKATERMDELKALGYDSEAIKKQREELEKRKERPESSARLAAAAPWFAASEAMARQPKAGEAPQTFIGSLASGAGAYGRTAIEQDDKEQARLEKLTDRGNALALAQNAEIQAQYSGNKAEIRDAQNNIKAARKDLATLGIKNIDAQNEMAKTVFEVQAKKDIAALDRSVQSNAINKQKAEVDAMAARYLKEGKAASPAEAYEKAYQTVKFQGVLGAADIRNTGKQQSDYQKYVKDFTTANLGTRNKPLEFSDWLATSAYSDGTTPVATSRASQFKPIP